MTSVVNWLEQSLSVSADTINKFVSTIAILIAIWLVRWGVLWLVAKRTEEPHIRYRWRKISTYTATIVGLILIGRVWLEAIQSVVTYLGLVSAGVAIALKDPITNWFGRLYIGWRKPFVVGDRVSVVGLTGDVIDIGMSTFSLLEVGSQSEGEQSSGRIIHMPNGKVFTEPLINYTQGFNYIWNEIPVTVTFESNWEKAKEILTVIVTKETAREGSDAQRSMRLASRQFLIRADGAPAAVYTKIVADGVLLTVRYLCEARRRRATEQAICEAILEAFSQTPDVDFAYRTSRIFRQTEEGKKSFRESSDS